MTTGVHFEKAYSKQQIKNHLRPSYRHELVEYLFYFLRVFLVVALVFSLIRTFVFYTIGIDGLSMNPNLQDQEIVYLDLLTPRFSDYRRGDIVVLRPPEGVFERENKLYIKRVIGLPGETVGYNEGEVIVYNRNYPDGITLTEPYLGDTVRTYKSIQKADRGFVEEPLGEGEYFVLGDNRTQSQDSRGFGEVQKGRIIGRVFFHLDADEGPRFFDLPRYNIAN